MSDPARTLRLFEQAVMLDGDARREFLDRECGADGALRADKRQGGERVTLSSFDPPDPNQAVDLLALDEALQELERLDARKAQVIELRVFAGLDFDEIAQVAGISRATLARDFRAARAWLYRALDLAPPAAPS